MDVEINADLRRFKQLIFNLISNAVKFNKLNGKITIVSYINEKREFVFEIKDTGDGIRKKDCDKIFNFFSQVNQNHLKHKQAHRFFCTCLLEISLLGSSRTGL